MSISDAPPTTPEERFRRAFEDHYRPIYAYAASWHTGRDAADDVVAEVFTTAWRRIDLLPGEPDTRPWLFGVARNVLRNSMRSNRRRSRLAERLASVRVEDVPEPAVADDGALAAALQLLSAEDREMLLLVAWNGLTPTDVAAVLGISANAARLRLHRARRKVAAQLGPGLDATCSPISGHDSVTTTPNEQEATS